MPQWILWCAIFALGASIGSFLNVCIHRLPRGESIVGPRSACPACGAPIAWYDNVPIVSYVLLRGRCRRCGAPIAIRYPLVEAATAVLFVLLFHVQGLTVLFFSQAFLGASLIALIPIDARHQILPDAITLPGIAVGLLTSPLRAAAAGSGSVPPLAAAREALLASALGFALPWMVNTGYRIWQAARGVPPAEREDGIGRGDFKLLAMIGAFLGVRLLLFTLFVGAVVGALFGLLMIRFGGYGWKSKLPYGVFLGGAAILALFVGDRSVAWYLRLMGIEP